MLIHKKRVVAVGTDQRLLLVEAAAKEQCSPTELVVEPVPGRDFWETPLDMAGIAAE